MRFHPSPEQTAQLSEQIHLGGIGRFDIERRYGRCRGLLGRRLGMPVEKFLQLSEIFLQRIEQVALVEGGGRVEQGENHKVLHVESLGLHLCDPDFRSNKCLRRPVAQRAHQLGRIIWICCIKNGLQVSTSSGSGSRLFGGRHLMTFAM